MPLKRIYYFTPSGHALDNLRNKHLKISRFSKCNDPFELACFNLQNRQLREQHKAWLAEMDKTNGLLCFSRTWRNPVMWSHYAEHHKGLCYGFDVEPEKFVDVRYVSQRLYPDIDVENFFDRVGEEQMVDLFATKFFHWAYEEEVRLLITFSNSVKTDELLFHPFSGEMELKEVIVGPKSNLTVKQVKEAIDGQDVKVFKTRLAFQRFEVTEQKNHSLW